MFWHNFKYELITCFRVKDVLFWLNRGIQFISAGSDLSAISSAAHAQSAMMRRVVEKLK